MSLASIDLGYLRERLAELNGRLCDAAEPTTSSLDGEPELVGGALVQLLGVLDHLDAGRRAAAGSQEINTLGEYGLHLLCDLADIARQLQQHDVAGEIEHLCLPFALWIVRNGGEIRTLSPVVNAMAFFASQSAQAGAMSTLYAHCSELIDAASPAAQEGFGEDPNHPLRLLLLKRAIVATRSHNPGLITSAYDAVIESLPDDAQRFLAEAMEQMTAIDYPQHVRDLVRRYYLDHVTPRRLH